MKLIDEVISAIKKLKNWKSAGIDSISREVFKAGGDEMAVLAPLYRLIETIVQLSHHK